VADVHTPQKRSFNMSQIRGRDTRPERIVRSLAHRMGYRFRLYSKDLPGKPDLVFPGRRKVLFVHGCFFHMHRCRYGRVQPKTNEKFWRDKRQSTVIRDHQNIAALRKAGWKVLAIWECWTRPRRVEQLPVILKEFLGDL